MRPIDADELFEKVRKLFPPYRGDEQTELEFEVAAVISEILDEINDEPTVNDWIPCSERMPEDDEDVLVSASEMVYIAYRFENAWYFDYGSIPERDVVAWKPLPEPYKEVKNGQVK